MYDRIPIDEKYTFVFDKGRVSILRHGKPWIMDPPASTAWISAAYEIEDLRTKLAKIGEVLDSDEPDAIDTLDRIHSTPRSREQCLTCGDDDHATGEHASPLDAIPDDLRGDRDA